MKIMHLADLHLGKHMNGFSLVEDQRYILNEILAIVEQQQTDVVVIAGDIYDKALPSVEAVQLLDQFLTDLTSRGQKVLMISGNHDSAQRIAFGSQVMRKAGVYVSPVFEGCPKPVQLQDEWGEVNFYLLPFIRPAVVRAAFLKKLQAEAPDQEVARIEKIQSYQDAMQYIMEHMILDQGKRNILVAHQFLTNASPSESEEFSVGGLENMDASLFTAFDYTALGHIHRAQKVQQETIRYAGTPLKYSFAEAGQSKTVTILTVKEKGQLSYEEIPLKPLRDCREIRGTYNEITARENYIHTSTEDYVHITLTDEEEILQAIGKLRVIYPNLIKLDYDNMRTRANREVAAPQEAASKSPMELFEEFYEMQNNQPMTERQRHFAQEVLQKIN